MAGINTNVAAMTALRSRNLTNAKLGEFTARLTLIAALLLASTPALAGPHCTDAPQSDWLTKEQMLQKIATLGHQVEVFKVTGGNCYEIYGRSAEGKRVEVYFHPVTGDVVKTSTL